MSYEYHDNTNVYYLINFIRFVGFFVNGNKIFIKESRNFWF